VFTKRRKALIKNCCNAEIIKFFITLVETYTLPIKLLFMKKTGLLLMLALASNVLFAQKKEEAEKLVAEGVAYHDKGDYEGAIVRYNSALELDKDNLLAMAEKSMSLLSWEKYDEAVECCKQTIAAHPGDKDLKTVYVTFGNAYDALNKTDKSVEVYNEGIKQFPDFYQLYFNKGITLSSVKKYDDALLCLQKSMLCNPKHAGSQSALARILKFKNKHIPALLAYCRFFVIEPESKRAKENLESVKKLVSGSAEVTGKNTITVHVTPDMLADTLPNGKPKENSFIATDVILATSSALDYEKQNKNKTEVEQFIRKFESVCSSLKESQKDGYGFYWDFYVPYFIEMQDKKLIETFAYVAFASSEDKDVNKWLKGHQKEIDKFYEWSSAFVWKKS